MNTDFFKPYAQRPIKILDIDARSPMFIPDLSLMGGLFVVDREWAQSQLPTKEYVPVQPMPGKALAAIHALSYNATDIGPYNEVSISVPCAYASGLTQRLPLVSQLKWSLSGFRRVFSGFVLDLPVTTAASVAGGVEWFNFPKYLADITFRETATHRICTVRDIDTKDLILEFEGRRIADNRLWGARIPEKLRSFDVMLLPRIKGASHKARMKIQMDRFAMSAGFGAKVRFGDSPRASNYSGAIKGPITHYIYAPKCRGILFEPEEI